MTHRIRVTCVLCSLVISLNAYRCCADQPTSQWRQLFNGKDLTGWTPKINGYEAGDNYADTFRVENGVIKVSYDKYDGPYNDRVGYLFLRQSRFPITSCASSTALSASSLRAARTGPGAIAAS